jgi:uncharacterized protein
MIRRTALVVLLLLINAQIGVGQEIKDHKLTVYGKVRVFAKADRAHIKFEIKGVGSSLKSAFESARVKLDTLSNRLYSIGLEPTNLSTSFFRTEENRGDKAFLSSKKDYRAVMVVTITTQKLELLEPIAIALSEGEIERIRDIGFDLTDYTQLRKDAIVKATIAAKEKAQLVAGTLGVQCGNVLEANEIRAEGNWGSRDPYNNALLAGVVGTPSSIYPDDVQFDAEVEIVFEIKSDLVDNAADTSKH